MNQALMAAPVRINIKFIYAKETTHYVTKWKILYIATYIHKMLQKILCKMQSKTTYKV